MSIQDVINANRVSKGMVNKVESLAQPKVTFKARADYWGDKAKFEETMQPIWDWGRARSDAARVVQAALETGALEFPKSAAVPKRLGLLVDYLHEVTTMLVDAEKELKDVHNDS